jgi:predicted ATPase
MAMGVILRGWAWSEEGRAEEGIAEMHRGLGDLRATGAELWRPSFLALLAEAYGRTGRPEEGLGALDEALAMVSKSDERAHEAELHRLRGELLRASGTKDEPEAAAAFQEALGIARRQEAKSLELRAAVSLARLWADHGRPGEARELLAGVYGWFTEGFGTADLSGAKALLEELDRSPGRVGLEPGLAESPDPGRASRQDGGGPHVGGPARGQITARHGAPLPGE